MKKFKTGDVLTSEGDQQNELFVLISGRVGVFKGDMQVAEFTEKGTIIGEMSVILNHPRTATVKALENTIALAIKADLDELMEKYPDISKKIIRSLAQRLMNTTDNYFELAGIADLDDLEGGEL
ncbi:MAG: cyclic nucleotide-binding domain-containing protein [Melioribacteraceae bacterium]|nr:cyclic nucleotide-binding domain-containing protein [Melioribacteraceae bacterium]MCF8355983.1 cyclic nucleotide-binding domain-containing protein [Melioribacteraceae bacterium]MCF8394611.1 cyclic nucleotide-binding domain-containing protein [Melioribacteraceae bacterium]MCF8419608.1 cyclic nucleotide-binding domain-containing protein [Melioribacteraceae bacterium]